MICSVNTHDGRRLAHAVPGSEYNVPIARGAWPLNKWVVSSIDSPIASGFTPNNTPIGIYNSTGAGFISLPPSNANIGDQRCTRWRQFGGVIGTARLSYTWNGTGYNDVVPLIVVMHAIVNYSTSPRTLWISAMLRSDWGSSLNACVVATSPFAGPNEDDTQSKMFEPADAMVLNENDFNTSDASAREVVIHHNPIIAPKNYSSYVLWGLGSTGQVSSASGGSFTLRKI